MLRGDTLTIKTHSSPTVIPDYPVATHPVSTKKNKVMNKKQQQKMNQTISCTADGEQKRERELSIVYMCVCMSGNHTRPLPPFIMAVYDLRTPLTLRNGLPCRPYICTVSRGGVRLETGTHKPQCTGVLLLWNHQNGCSDTPHKGVRGCACVLG